MALFQHSPASSAQKFMNNETTFYIVRHGQSQGNANPDQGVILEQQELGSDLTERGILQARETAIRLEDIAFDKVYSSDLIRAHRTAEIIAKERRLFIETTKLLRERSRGKIVGDLEKKIAIRLGNIFNEMELMTKEEQSALQKKYGIELREETTTRVIMYLRELALAHPKKTILIVCHGAIMRSLLIHFGYCSPEELPAGSVENGAYFVVKGDGINFTVGETFKINKESI